MLIDLHTHSNQSDGTDTPAAVLRNAYASRLDVVALTDHDTISGWADARSEAARLGLVFVPGVELSTNHHGSAVHLLAYGPDPTDAPLLAEMERLRESRQDRLSAMLAQLASHDVILAKHDVLRWAGDADSVGRPHIADAMIEAGYVGSRDEAFDLWLAEGKPGYLKRYSTRLVDAIDLVHRAGGAAVIAHPWARKSKRVLPVDELARLVESTPLVGFEVDHQEHDAHSRAELRSLADEIDAIATGSSDYHGTGKRNHDLGCNVTPMEEWERLRQLIAPSLQTD